MVNVGKNDKEQKRSLRRRDSLFQRKEIFARERGKIIQDARGLPPQNHVKKLGQVKEGSRPLSMTEKKHGVRGQKETSHRSF